MCVADRSSCNTLTYTAGVHLDAAAGKKLKICYLKIDVSYEASAKFHHMSQSDTPATENEATSHLKLSDNATLCDFSHRHGNFLPPRSLAKGCKRLWTVADTKTASSEHTSTPRPPECKTGTLRYAFGKTGKWLIELLSLFLRDLVSETSKRKKAAAPISDPHFLRALHQ